MIHLANRTRVRSARYARYLYPVLFILLDYVAILLAEQEALGLHHLIDRHTAPYAIAPQYIYLWIPLIFILFLGQAHAYRQMHSILDSSRESSSLCSTASWPACSSSISLPQVP